MTDEPKSGKANWLNSPKLKTAAGIMVLFVVSVQLVNFYNKNTPKERVEGQSITVAMNKKNYCAATDKEKWIQDFKEQYKFDFTPKPDCK